MSRSESSLHSSSHSTQNHLDSIEQPWIGYSFPSRFVVRAEDLDSSVETGDEWFENIEKGEPDRDNGVIQFSPTREDALRNSNGSGDGNILHEDVEAVARFIDQYGRLAREPAQDEEIVVSQGMSVKDALAHSRSFDGPVEELSGSWKNMVYAAKNHEESDTVVVTSDDDDGYTPVILPAGDFSNPIPGEDGRSGGVNPVYADSLGFAEDHNLKMVNLEDLAVGRGFETSDKIRYGELLLANKSSVNTSEIQDEIDLDQLWDGDAYIFNLDSIEKQRLGVRGNYQVDIHFGDEIVENALDYSEDALYARDFHNKMDLPYETEVEEYSENSSSGYPANPFAVMLRAQVDGLRQLNRIL